jgi:hypothetical protein
MFDEPGGCIVGSLESGEDGRAVPTFATSPNLIGTVL